MLTFRRGRSSWHSLSAALALLIPFLTPVQAQPLAVSDEALTRAVSEWKLEASTARTVLLDASEVAPPRALESPLLVGTGEAEERASFDATLSGAWGGLRPGLYDRGITLEANYAGDVFANVKGGLQRRATYLHNVDVLLHIDAEEALGWPGLQICAYGLGNYGGHPSDHTGDLQGVNNIEAPDAWRLYEAWVQQEAFGGRLSLLAGLYDLNSEYYVLESAGLFINGAQGIGAEIAETGANGPSIFPVTSLALHLRLAPTDAVYVQAAAFDAVPGDVDRPEATHVSLSSEEGALLTGEIGWHPSDRPGSKFAVGAWAYTSPSDGVTPREPATGRGSAGFYLLAEGPLHREAADEAQGLVAFGRFGVADGRWSPVRMSWGAGLVYTGPFGARAADQIGLALAVAHLTPAAAALSSADTAEVTLEATYRLQLTPWLTFQPDVQYVINPSMDPAVDDALVIGQRLEISF